MSRIFFIHGAMVSPVTAVSGIFVGSGLVLCSPVFAVDIILCSPALLMSYFSKASDREFVELFYMSAISTPLIAPFIAYPFGIAHALRKEKTSRKQRGTIEGARKFKRGVRLFFSVAFSD